MSEPGKSASAERTTSRWERLAFTLDANTGEILKFESVDAAGHRRELSKSERLDLAKQARGPGVQALVERAFEAGIGCVLDGEDEDEASETEDEAGLARILLKPLVEESTAARAMRREALRRAIVQTLIQDIDISRSGDANSEPSKQTSDRATPKSST